jgi:hypothetical protein
MHLGEISFCDKIGFNVRCDNFKKYILEKLDALYSFKIINKHHDIVKIDNEASLTFLKQKQYWLSLRSNGNPYFLYFTKFNGINQVLFIDKKIQQGYTYPRMVIIKLWVNEDLFQDTLFDGEMVKCKSGQWVFLVNDVLVLRGYKVYKTPFVKRLTICHSIFTNSHTRDIQDICAFQIKKYFPLSEFENMIEFAKALEYTNRGVYFTFAANDTKPFRGCKVKLYNFNDDLITKKEKVKYAKYFGDDLNSQPDQITDNTPIMDQGSVYCLQKTNQIDIYNVFSSNKLQGIALVNNMKTSKMLRDHFATCTPVDKVPFHCVWNEKFKKWDPRALVSA